MAADKKPKWLRNIGIAVLVVSFLTGCLVLRNHLKGLRFEIEAEITSKNAGRIEAQALEIAELKERIKELELEKADALFVEALSDLTESKFQRTEKDVDRLEGFHLR